MPTAVFQKSSQLTAIPGATQLFGAVKEKHEGLPLASEEALPYTAVSLPLRGMAT